MSKSNEELNKIKEEVEAVNEKLAELTPEELAKVNGGAVPGFGAYGKEVKKKDVVMIVGPHGVGKTTLLKMLSEVDID